jgi:N-acetyl-anhydromuramyl-L-alanine amidase AmpD
MISINKASLGLLNDTKSYALDSKATEKTALAVLNLKDIIQVDFPDNQYMKEQTNKKQIVLHHTVSGQGVDGDISWWKQTPDRVGTAVIVGWDGKIYQCFSTIYWAHHLGCTTANNTILNKGSIGIEIDSWGGLALNSADGKYYPAIWDTKLKRNVPNMKAGAIKNVQLYDKPYRGYNAFEKYTAAQIEAVRELLVFWHNKFNIPLTYNPDMWDFSPKAMTGAAGVWTHVSFRKDKSDCHPQPELIAMLKSLV